MSGVKEPIRIREKKLKGENISLYLDIYRNGRRKYEFLKLYLIPEKTKADKERNRQTLQLANAIKAKRIVELQNKAFGFEDGNSAKILFFDYYRKVWQEKTSKNSGTWRSWESALRHLMIYEGNEKITFSDITTEWVKGFRKYLDKEAVIRRFRATKYKESRPLSQNSKCAYFAKLRACIFQAYKDGVISDNPLRGVNRFSNAETTRMYLTIDEVKRLAQTDCTYPIVKKAFLFSCLTGLRRSDILDLTWGDVFQQGEFARIIFKQKKTRGQEYLDINLQAKELMGEPDAADCKVFSGIPSPYFINVVIRGWVKLAGIQKDITFHCARHTFATMMLDLGTDLYTVSKLLGHRNISTTQIYTKVLDKNKQKAIANIPDILSKE